jgi:hypothetical protein
MSQTVTVIGPNLRDQSKGSFHVHAAGCADIKRSARRDPEFENGWDIDAENLTEVVDAVYPPEDFGCESGEYLDEFHIAPCVKLPVQ